MLKSLRRYAGLGPKILISICDSCDLCQKTGCHFYDTSKSATERYMRSVAWNAQHPEMKLKYQLPPFDCPLL